MKNAAIVLAAVLGVAPAQTTVPRSQGIVPVVEGRVVQAARAGATFA
jgi:hypothetical protein